MDTVGSYIERQRAALVGLLANLVRTPSPNPPGDTRAVADLITARLRESAVDFQVLSDEPRKPTSSLASAGDRPSYSSRCTLAQPRPGIAARGGTARLPRRSSESRFDARGGA